MYELFGAYCHHSLNPNKFNQVAKKRERPETPDLDWGESVYQYLMNLVPRNETEWPPGAQGIKGSSLFKEAAEFGPITRHVWNPLVALQFSVGIYPEFSKAELDLKARVMVWGKVAPNRVFASVDAKHIEKNTYWNRAHTVVTVDNTGSMRISEVLSKLSQVLNVVTPHVNDHKKHAAYAWRGVDVRV